MRTILTCLIWASLVLFVGGYAANTQRIAHEFEVLRFTREALDICRETTCDARIFQRLLEIEDTIALRPLVARQQP